MLADIFGCHIWEEGAIVVWCVEPQGNDCHAVHNSPKDKEGLWRVN